MMNRKQFATAVTVLLGTAIFTPALQARTCTGNGEVIGSYGFFGSRSGFFLLGATPPGTTPTTTGTTPLIPIAVTPPGTTASSNTAWGRFVTSLTRNAVFSGTGRFLADGAGNLYASSSPDGLSMNTLVGSYTVNSDCSIRMTLQDAFLTSPGAPGFPATITGNSVTLEGELFGDQIEAVVTGSGAAGATVSFIKTQQFSSCTNAILTGNYGVVGSGMLISGFVNVLTPAGGTGITSGGAFIPGITGPLGTPFNLLGRFDANGAGLLLPELNPAVTPLARQLTGTYTVNADCTGIATLIDETGVTRNISFLVLNEASPSTGVVRQTLRFVFTNTGVIGDGIAKPQ